MSREVGGGLATYIESAAGVAGGARAGFSDVITAGLFLLYFLPGVTEIMLG